MLKALLGVAVKKIITMAIPFFIKWITVLIKNLLSDKAIEKAFEEEDPAIRARELSNEFSF